MKKPLEEKDKHNIFNFVKRFRSHSDEIKDLEKKLNEALKRLRKTREDEKIFSQSLCEKYGKGHFDLTDLNYWIID